jgi:ligand-binding sensor domain-containing protein/signal transduction histidine kinase
MDQAMKIKFIHFNNISFWRLRFIIIITVLLGPITGLALDPNKAITQYIHDVWQTEDGLPHENIIAIIQTHDGYIWLGTPVGLVRFDGVQFTLFDKSNTANIKNNNITELFEDRKGTLWIGSEGGLYQLNDGEFTLYTVKDGLSSNYIRSIYEDKEGSLWIGTYGGGANRLRDGKFTFYTTQEGLSYDYVMSICEDREGNLWIGTQGRGLNRLKDGKITTYTTQDGLSNDVVMSVYEDREGNLWIGTYGGGVNKLQDGKFTSYTTSEGLSHNSVISIVEDKDGNLWISTDGGGVSRLKDGKFSTFTTKDGLSNNIVRSIFEDREGSLWIGTYGGGLNRLRDGKFTTYTSKEGLSGELVMSVYKDTEGILWLGTSVGGINRFKDGKFTAYTTKEGLSHNIVTSIYEDRNETLWIGTLGGGINRFKDGKFTTYARKEGLHNPYIRSLCTSKDGSLWIGTHGSGLFCMNDEKFTNYTVEDGLSNGIIWSIYEDRKGSLWVGTNGGLNRFKDGEFTTYTTKEGLSDDIVQSIYEDREGNLWVGTRHSGLNLYRDGEFTTYTKQEGLYEESIFKILEDNKGNLWMSSMKGIFRVCKKELIDFADRKIKSINSYAYDKADGMKSNECTPGCPAGWKSSDGKLWFPTMKGLAMIDPENIKINEQPPPVVLEQIIIDNELINLEENVPFSPGKKKFELHYTGLSFLVPEKVKFKYKLDGFDNKWVDAETRRTAYYTNIPPGDYTFKVIACNNDGIWNEEGTSIKLTILPPFWQTWWFRGSVVIVILLAIFSVHQVRTHNIRERSKQLEKRVEERTIELNVANKELQQEITERKKTEKKIEKTMEDLESSNAELNAANKELDDFAYIVSHDLKAPLRAVSQLAAWISQDYSDAFDKDGKEQMNLLIGRVKRMGNLIGGILEYSRAGRTAEKEEEINLNSIAREAIGDIAPPDNIKITIENELPVVLADRVRIEQVFQNLISNAIKFMDKPKGKIKIGCVDEGTHWRFSVADNGPGIDEKYHDKIFQIFQTLESRDERESTGVGLSVVKKLIELYGGKIWVESKLGKGSTFFFTLNKRGSKDEK